MIRRAVAVALAFGLILTIPLVAGAEEGDAQRTQVELTDEQVALNAAGVEALIEQEPARAVALITDAYRIEPANILALNLGRAYHFLGQCDRAREQLEKVSQLPAVEEPPADRIDQRAQEYLDDVESSCEDDETTAVDAPDADEQPEADEEVDLDEIEATADLDDSDEQHLSFAPSRTAAWITISGGGVLIAGGAGLHLAARHQRARVTDFEGNVNSEVTQVEAHNLESRANAFNTVALISAVAGASFAGIGTYLLLRNPSQDMTVVDFEVGDGFRGISVRHRF